MSARRPLFNCIVAPLAAGPMSPADAKGMLDNYRAEVLAEAADLIEAAQNDADDAAADHHGALTDAETAAHIAVRRMAKRLRDAAGGAA